MRILAFAYACEPQEGSEPGAGWAFARMLAGLGETWVITRANNRSAIEAELPTIAERDRLHFVYVDLPRWARFWKRGRIGLQPYYLLWQFAALRVARREHRGAPFDLVWHITLANAWIGSAGALVGPPFVLGPIGGAVDVPWRMAPVLGVRGSVYEAVRSAVRRVARYGNPLARVSWRRAELILAQNRETRAWFPRSCRAKTEIFFNVALGPLTRRPDRTARTTDHVALFAGRLMQAKGLPLALRALALLPGWTFLICGRGSEEQRLRSMAERLGIDDRVRFLGHVPRDEVLRLMREEADLFLFTSLRDDAGWAVAEAVALGLPVVCLDRGGPPMIVGDGVPISSPTRTADHLAAAVRRAAVHGSPNAVDVDLPSRRAALYDVLERRGVVHLSSRPVAERSSSRMT